MPDLTTLPAAKAWLRITGDDDDAVLRALIRQVSGFVLNYIGRPTVFKKEYIDRFTGSGGAVRFLRNYPVLGISGVSAGGGNVPASAFWFDPDSGVAPGRVQSVTLTADVFPPGPCVVTYTAGYFVSGETQAAAKSVLVDAPDGQWMIDGDVTYAIGGAALALVAASPAQGQYTLGDRGEYVFADADAGVPVLISYSFVPAVLEQACLELVAERYGYRDRVGQSSVNTSGQVVAFKLTDMPDYIRTSLEPFKNRVPV